MERMGGVNPELEELFHGNEARENSSCPHWMMSDYTVETINDGINEFNVQFHGPKESIILLFLCEQTNRSLYEGDVWKVRGELPDVYRSGSVCLDVINQSWSPMFDLLNIFEVFLPWLLLYPNPSDPLNGYAASLMMKDKKQYEQKVKEYCERCVKKEHMTNTVSDRQ